MALYNLYMINFLFLNFCSTVRKSSKLSTIIRSTYIPHLFVEFITQSSFLLFVNCNLTSKIQFYVHNFLLGVLYGRLILKRIHRANCKSQSSFSCAQVFRYIWRYFVLWP